MKLAEISELFEQAIAISDPDARAEFVASACPDKADRKKLERLIAADAATCQIMDNPEAAVRIAEKLQDRTSGIASSEECPVREGDRLGNYKLLQHIGEGGMGYVFMADQLEPIQRRVAVKIIKTPHSSRQVLARFEAERAALSRLDHPNITRIFDAGATDAGLPYFVMELVRGDSMVEYCDRHKLSIRERVALLEQACLAAHHAHQKGIIHRDLKPANIMITMHDGQPVPKVIDFGIAKALDRPLIEGTLFTRYGDMVGTPQYMSPEQAEKSGLDLDVRTDIYSLGAVLFELLTGSPPIEPALLEGKGVLGVLETVRDNDTETPSARATKFMSLDDTVASHRGTDRQQLPRLLRGELDWIALKSLARDRSQRYESAAAMARDLRAYLSGDNVDAAAPTFLYQARKLFQRHKPAGILMLSWALMMVALTLFSFGWAVSNNRLRKLATDRAEQLSQKTQRLQESLTRERTATERARKAEQQALLLVNEKKEQAALDRAVRRHMAKMLKSRENRIGVVSPKVLRMDLSESELPGLKKLLKDLVPESTDGAKPKSVVISSGSKVFSESIGSQILGSLEGILETNGEAANRGLGAMRPALFNMIFPQPNELSNLVIEQFRSEFGDNHPRIAAALVHSCRVGILNEQLKPDVIESRLRESLAILSDVSEPVDKVVRIETELLLSQSLHKAGRSEEAKEHLVAAEQDFESVRGELHERTSKQLQSELTRVKTALSGE